MKYAFFTIFALLIACRDETPEPAECLSMTISDALPVQFWLTGCETYNESEPDGVFKKCFCQMFQCGDTINFQFTDNSGDQFYLLIYEEDTLLNTVPFDEYQNVYSVSFSPESLGCSEITLRFEISKTATVSELLEDPEFDIGGDETINFVNPNFATGNLTPWLQLMPSFFIPEFTGPWLYQSDGGNQIARSDYSVPTIQRKTRILCQPNPLGGNWPAGDYEITWHLANLSTSGTNNVDAVLIAFSVDGYQILDTKQPISGAGFNAYVSSVAITQEYQYIGVYANRNVAGTDLDIKLNDLDLSAPVVVDSIWQNVATDPGATAWSVNAGVASVALTTSTKSFVAPLSAPVAVGSQLTIVSQIVLPAGNTYNISALLYDQDQVHVQSVNIAFGQAPGTFNINFTTDVTGIGSPNSIYFIGIYVSLASGSSVPANVQANYFRLSGNTTTTEASSDCIKIAETFSNTILLEYSNRRNYAGIINDGSAGTPDQTTFYLRIPAIFNKQRFPETDQVETLSNNRDISLNSQVEKQKLIKTDYLPDYMHLKILLALKHQFLRISGVDWVKKESYEQQDTKEGNTVSRATCYLNEKEYIVRNVL